MGLLYQYFTRFNDDLASSKFILLIMKSKVYLIIVFGLLSGGFFAFYIPPWQKPDEPGHFEFAWLIANYKKLPKIGDFDSSVRKDILTSMLENNFFNGNLQPPNLLSTSTPPWIGYPQINEKPLYYMFVSIPLFILKSSDVTFQLYIARVTSLMLFIGTLVITIRIIEMTLGRQHILSLMIPLSLTLHPSFVDVMTAVNDDVGATFIFSLLLFLCVSTLKHGLSIKMLLFLLLTLVLCYFTKDTLLVSIPIVLLVIILSKIPNDNTLLVKLSIGSIIIIFILGLFLIRWGDARNWLRTSQTTQLTPTSVTYSNAPWGNRVLELFVSPNQSPPRLIQFVNLKSINDNSIFSIGGHIWTNQDNLKIIPFRIYTNNKEIDLPYITITNEIQFFYFSFLASGNQTIRVEIKPIDKTSKKDISVYYDNLILIEGEFPNNFNPDPHNFSNNRIWDELMKLNQIDNPSFEITSPFFNPKFSILVMSNTRGLYSPNLILSSLFDLNNSGWYYRSTIKQLTSTFWAKFGWGHVTLTKFPIKRPYLVLGMITLLGIIGFFSQLLFHKQTLDLKIKMILLFLVSAFIIWIMTFFRGITSLENIIFIPGARYAFPAIIPTMTILHLGWYFPYTHFEFNRGNFIYFFAVTSSFVILFVSSIISILDYYYLTLP